MGSVIMAAILVVPWPHILAGTAGLILGACGVQWAFTGSRVCFALATIALAVLVGVGVVYG